MEKEDLYLCGGVQLRDPGERGVEALHRLLAPLPLAGAVLRTVAQGRGLLNTGNLSMEWELCRQNYTDWSRDILHSLRKIDIYLCRICCPEGTPGYNCHRKSKLWSWSKIFFFILLAMSMSSCWSGTLWGLQSLAENKYKLIIIISKMVCFKTKIYPF